MDTSIPVSVKLPIGLSPQYPPENTLSPIVTSISIPSPPGSLVALNSVHPIGETELGSVHSSKSPGEIEVSIVMETLQ